MKKKTSDAAKKAAQKYIREKRAKITVLTTPDKKEKWKRAAQHNGKSLNKYIIDTVDGFTGDDSGKA